jgi:hypothetical protein
MKKPCSKPKSTRIAFTPGSVTGNGAPDEITVFICDGELFG